MNLVLYVVSGVFQPLFIMEMDYAGVGKQLGLLYMLPYYVGMACVLPFATQPLRLFMPGSVPWRKVCVITGVDVRAESRSPRRAQQRRRASIKVRVLLFCVFFLKMA